MSTTLYTPDGKCHVVIRTRDLYEIIEEYAGLDAAKAIADCIDEINSSAEEEIEDLRREVSDFSDEVDTLQDALDQIKAICREI